MWKYFDSKRGERLRRDLLQCESDEKSVASVRKLLSLTHYEEECVSERVSGGRLGAVLAAVDVNGWTVLQLAALHGHIETVRTLRDYAVSEGVSEGVSGKESSDTMKCFLAACEHEGVCGMTPLLVAISSGHEALACLLLQAGVSTACTGSRARNCLYLICRANMSEALRCLLTVESIESVRSLAAAPDTSGYNALHASVLVGHVDMCEAILWADVSGDIGRACMTSKSKDDSNVFHLVARLSKIQMCTNKSRAMTAVLLAHLRRCYPNDDTHRNTLKQLLLSHDCFGSTPLHVAAVTANSACLELLVDSHEGGGPASMLVAQDNDGYHPTVIACVEFARVATEFSSQFPSRSMFILNTVTPTGDEGEEENSCVEEKEACELKNRGGRLANIVLGLLSTGYPLDSVDYSSNTIFHSLAYSESDPVTSLLVAIVNQFSSTPEKAFQLQRVLEITNDSGWTCFHVALTQGHPISIPPPKEDVPKSFFSCLFKYTSADFQAQFDASKPKIEDHSDNQRAKCGAHRRIPLEERRALLHENYTLQGAADFLLALPHPPRVVVVAGAGISTSAGIPDFRSSNGLYASSATAELFSTEYLHNRPEQFFGQLKELFLPVVDKQYRPTASHALLRLMHDCGWLTRVYTQNIDMLESVVFETENEEERSTPLVDEKVVECHGSMRRFRCTSTLCPHIVTDPDDMQEQVWAKIRRGETPLCPRCGDLLRPDVTFFGEPLPDKFHEACLHDLPNCDFLLVMGTSLLVYPVASLPQMVGANAVRMLWNREATGCFQFIAPGNDEGESSLASRTQQVETRGYRDIFHQDDCDSAARHFAEMIGKSAEMNLLLAKYA